MGKHNFLILEINQRIAETLLYQGSVVDLGCGTAPYREVILRKAERYIGLDWPSSLHGGAEVDVYADVARALPIAANAADTVVAFQVMEHLAEPEQFLAECYRILRPHGRLFLTIPFMWQVHEAPHDYFRYTCYGLQHLLQKHHFQQIEITANTGFWQTWILKFNYHSQRYVRLWNKPFFYAIWWIGQKLAPFLDRYDHKPEETASYTVLAVK